MPLMLTRLFCDNYKCLVNFEFRPKSLQLLMGRNGAGKSTVFEVLELLRDFAARGDRCEGRLVGRTKTRWQDIEQQRFELEVTGNGGVYVYELLVDEWGQPAYPRVLRESVTLDGTPLFRFENGTLHLYNDHLVDKVQFAFDDRRSGLAIIESRSENRKLGWLKEWLSRLLYVQIDPKRMGARADKESVYPAFDLENFAEWYRHLRLDQGKATVEVSASLREIIPGFESLDLKDAGLNTRVLQVAARAGKGKSQLLQYAFDELSDGQRALVGLYTLLHCSLANGATLCIDEPDNFVALAEIQPWLSRLRDIQDIESQVLIASHHPELLNELATRNGVVLDRVDGRQSLVKPWAPPSDTTLTPAEIVARGWERG